MAVENITLNLIPTGDTPSIHVAQFDVDRPFNVTLKEGEDDFTPTGYDIELQVRKVDNNIVTTVPTQISGNVVTFNTTEQMTACSGTNIAELQLTKDSQTFATLHFYLVVQRDVLAGGVTSESDIYNLTEQIAAIVPEVIGDDYYNKEEVDEKIADIPTFDPTNYYDKSEVDEKIAEIPTFDPTNYYNKSETDALLNDKADVSDLPDMTNYYNKSETDALLNDKADVSDLPDMTDYYTKEEVDNEVYNILPTDTASGSIASLSDGADNIPVKSLVSQIVATGGGGTPDAPIAINGFDSGVITRCGKNLVDETQFVQGSITGAGADSVSYTRLRSPLTKVKPNTVYSFATNSVLLVFEIHEYDKNGIWLQYTSINQTSGIITTTANTGYVKILIRNSTNTPIAVDELTTFQMKIGTATTYEAYKGNTYEFAFGQTVYGGYFDNKGNLVVTHGHIASYNGETINEPWVSSMDNYVPNTSPSIGAEVVYPLATPITLSITSQDIPTFLGENNIFSNCGDVEVDYRADIGLYIDKKISE